MEYDERYFETNLSGYGRHGGYSQMKNYIQTLYFGIIKRLELFELYRGSGKRSLDVGCGYGYLCEVLKSFGYEVYGIDVSKVALLKAQKLLGSNIVLVCCDAQKAFPFNLKFDLITIFETLEHLERPELAIENCYNSLKDSGILIALTPNRISPYKLYLRDVTHINVKSIPEWKRILLKYPWSTLKIFSFQWFPLFWNFSPNRFLQDFILKFPLVGYLLVIVGKKPKK